MTSRPIPGGVIPTHSTRTGGMSTDGRSAGPLSATTTTHPQTMHYGATTAAGTCRRVPPGVMFKDGPTRPSPRASFSPKVLLFSEGTVGTRVATIFSKLDLSATLTHHRRILAVLRFLDGNSGNGQTSEVGHGWGRGGLPCTWSRCRLEIVVADRKRRGLQVGDDLLVPAGQRDLEDRLAVDGQCCPVVQNHQKVAHDAVAIRFLVVVEVGFDENHRDLIPAGGRVVI